MVDFVIHWNETAMGLHVFPIPIPPPTSPTTIFCCDTCSLNRRRHGFLSCVCTLTHFIIGGWLLYGSVVPSALCACWSCARPHRLKPTRLLQPWDSPGKSAAVGCCALLQRIFCPRDWTCISYICSRWQESSLPLVLPEKSQLLSSCVQTPLARIIKICYHDTCPYGSVLS